MKAKAIFFSLFFVLGGFALNAQDLSIDADKASMKFYFVAEKTSGTVSGLNAKISFDPNNPGKASISGSVNASTLSTGNAKRDEHLKSADFFNVAKYPKMSFKSSSVTKIDGGFLLKGHMTIKDVTKPVSFKFSFNDGKFEGKGSINAKDFGVSPKKTDKESQVKIKIMIPTT